MHADDRPEEVCQQRDEASQRLVLDVAIPRPIDELGKVIVQDKGKKDQPKGTSPEETEEEVEDRYDDGYNLLKEGLLLPVKLHFHSVKGVWVGLFV